MLFIKVIRVCWHLVVGLWTCALVFPLTDAHGRNWRIQHWSRGLLKICGVQARVLNPHQVAEDRHGLLVSNHISWIDIFVINAMQTQRFVAKSDIRSWPLIGYLCAQSGTIFIARGRLRDVRRIFHDLVESLRHGEHIGFFPEGTTAEQGKLLPFHANLFESAIDAKVEVCPMSLRYTDGQGKLHPAANFVGEMSFAESLITILRAGGMRAELTLLPAISSVGAHRRDLAQQAQAMIADSLGCENPSVSQAVVAEDN